MPTHVLWMGGVDVPAADLLRPPTDPRRGCCSWSRHRHRSVSCLLCTLDAGTLPTTDVCCHTLLCHTCDSYVLRWRWPGLPAPCTVNCVHIDHSEWTKALQQFTFSGNLAGYRNLTVVRVRRPAGLLCRASVKPSLTRRVLTCAVHGAEGDKIRRAR